MLNVVIDYDTKEVKVECADGTRFSFTAECDVYDDYALACEVRERVYGQ